MDFSALFTVEHLVTLLTLTALEIVLGIDNVIFIAILSGRLPKDQQNSARQIGLFTALATRIMLLLSLTWIMGLVEPLFGIAGREFSGRDIILIVGGLFLLAKSTMEMHHSLEGHNESQSNVGAKNFFAVIGQIAILDIVFSLDSVITAVGLSGEVPIMIVAIIISVIIMLIFAKPLSEYIEQHPTLKILALSFLLLIGMSLVAEGFEFHLDKAYIYFAMAFSVGVELLNIRMRKGKPVTLHQQIVENEK